MQKRKYALLKSDLIRHEGVLLYRIRHLKTGKLGGYIQSEENLSQEGEAWVHPHAKVRDDAVVYGGAQVFGNALVYEGAKVFDEAQVFGNARVGGEAWISGQAQVFGHARIWGEPRISGHAWICGHAQILDQAQISGDVQVFANAEVRGQTHLTGDVRITQSPNPAHPNHSETWLTGLRRSEEIKSDSGLPGRLEPSPLA